jgi:prepilin-type processing-associated H-X9-DG protein
LDGKVHRWFPFDDTGGEANWQNAEFWVDGARHGPSNITKAQSHNQPYMNALFCDGHASPVSVKEAWQAICNPDGHDAHAYP